MNRKIMVLAAGLLALAMVAGVDVALAQEKSSAINIAVVDVQFLMQNSDAAKNIRAQIEKMRAGYQQEIKSKQENIDKLNQSIAQERPTLSEDVYQQRVRELRQKAANYRIDMQERQDKLDGAFRGASQKIAAKIVEVVNEVKKERDFTLVLSRSAIIDTPGVPDVTQEVLRRLNQRMPSVALDLPK